MKISRYFAQWELACKDGTPLPPRLFREAQQTCQRADKLREVVGPLHVNSGYRTPSHNEAVGGAEGSFHMRARALDLWSETWTPQQLADIYEGLIRLGVVPDGGLGVYDSHIHIDTGPGGRRWPDE